MTDQEIHKLAKRRVREKKTLFTHITLYFFGIGILFLLNFFLINTHRPWFHIPAIFWGIGLAIHGGLFIYNRKVKSGTKNWEEKEMEKEIRRLKKLRDSRSDQYENRTVFEDNLELKDFEPLRKEWDDEDLV